MSGIQPTAPVGAPRLRIHLLGGFEATVDGRPIPAGAWRLHRAKAVVKLLALANDYALHRDQLLDILWPDSSPTAAATSLRQAIHAARRALGSHDASGALLLSQEGTRLALRPRETVWVDSGAFEAAVTASRGAGDLTVYQTALSLYTGDLLPEDQYEDWTAARREALRGLYLSLLAELAERGAAQGDSAVAIATWRRLVDAEPSHEPAHRQLMDLYARTGQRALALRQYARLRDALRRELDTEPDAASQQLYARLRRDEAAALPAVAAPAPPSGNLPAPLTSFVGRERELAEVRHRLGATRLLTLTGTGGVGKTRLALEAARAIQADYPAGVWLVDLAGPRDGGLVAPAVAAVLGVREQPGQATLDALSAALREQRALLVLDNCEHLAAACAALIDQLLRSCPRLRVLATSRQRLDCVGELAWRAPSLGVPALGEPWGAVSASDAARLFVARARLVQPDFELTAATAPLVMTICRQVDGLPLAIELAAARLGVLGIAQLATRLDDRLQVLTGGSRTAPPRHQTLRATLDWSYGLLAEAERALLARLSVFSGGFRLEAAEAVGAGESASGRARPHGVADRDAVAPPPTLDLLARLVDHSLVMAEPRDDGTMRYRLLETVRQYATERLAASHQAEAAHHRHATHYLALVEEAAPILRATPGRRDWHERLREDYDNVRAALGWARDRGEAETSLRFCGALPYYWTLAHHQVEGYAWTRAALALPGAGTPATRARALWAAGSMARGNRDLATALAYLEASLALYTDIGDERSRAEVLLLLGTTATWAEDYPRARRWLEEALVLRGAGAAAPGSALPLFHLGSLALFERDFGRARALLKDALAALRATGDDLRAGHTLFFLGFALLGQGDLATARHHFAESLAFFATLGEPWGLTIALEGVACLAAANGWAAPAWRLAGAAAAIRDQRKVVLAMEVYAGLRARFLEPARRALDSGAQAAAWAAGQALTLDEAVATARTLLGESPPAPGR